MSESCFGVYQAIAAVQHDLAESGIGKLHKNPQGYVFRGIDDIYNALAPVLAKHKLCILPRVLTRTSTERVTQKGGVLFYVVLDVEFDFVSATDGSKHVVKTFGEAMDSADKATNKAMSAAYKYACMQTFCIPTEGNGDSDASTPDVAPSKPKTQQTQQTNQPNQKPSNGTGSTNGQAPRNTRPQPQQPSKPTNGQQANGTNQNPAKPELTVADRLANGIKAINAATNLEEVESFVQRLKKYNFDERQQAVLTDAVNARMQFLAPAQTQNVDEIPF